jgi:hypothetical protein
VDGDQHTFLQGFFPKFLLDLREHTRSSNKISMARRSNLQTNGNYVDFSFFGVFISRSVSNILDRF